MRFNNRSRFLTLSGGQWWAITFFVVVAFPLILGLTSIRDLYDWYLVERVEPRLERELGFEGSPVVISRRNPSHPVYIITSVEPGGIFDHSGVNAGDIPTGYQHGQHAGFIGQLHGSRGSEVRLRLLTRGELEAGEWRGRTVSVRVP